MRRVVLLAIALAALCAGVAFAASSATLTVDPNEAGKGTIATLEATPPNHASNPDSVALRVARGVKVDKRAVPGRCSDAQAKANDCPSNSRIGGGDATVRVTPNVGKFTVPIDLYLTRPRHAGDIAGIVGIATVGDQKRHAFGRVFKIDYPKYGIQTEFDGLRGAMKAPPGFKAQVTHLHLRFGRHRRVAGVRHDLITNPPKCPKNGWPYMVIVRYRHSGDSLFHDTVDCTK